MFQKMLIAHRTRCASTTVASVRARPPAASTPSVTCVTTSPYALAPKDSLAILLFPASNPALAAASLVPATLVRISARLRRVVTTPTAGWRTHAPCALVATASSATRSTAANTSVRATSSAVPTGLASTSAATIPAPHAAPTPSAALRTIAPSARALPTSWAILSRAATRSAPNTRNAPAISPASISSAPILAQELVETTPTAASRTTKPSAAAPKATPDIRSTAVVHSLKVTCANLIPAVATPIANRVPTARATTAPFASAVQDSLAIL